MVCFLLWCECNVYIYIYSKVIDYVTNEPTTESIPYTHTKYIIYTSIIQLNSYTYLQHLCNIPLWRLYIFLIIISNELCTHATTEFKFIQRKPTQAVLRPSSINQPHPPHPTVSNTTSWGWWFFLWRTRAPVVLVVGAVLSRSAVFVYYRTIYVWGASTRFPTRFVRFVIYIIYFDFKDATRFFEKVAYTRQAKARGKTADEPSRRAPSLLWCGLSVWFSSLSLQLCRLTFGFAARRVFFACVGAGGIGSCSCIMCRRTAAGSAMCASLLYLYLLEALGVTRRGFVDIKFVDEGRTTRDEEKQTEAVLVQRSLPALLPRRW